MNFRADINGLRAIAVLSVVLYHFGILGGSGGFVGVDVFFVISGFLMTGIIFTKIKNESFSILDFYNDRAKRIIPALAFLCFTLLVFGWFYLVPDDFLQLGAHVASSITFLSNVNYWLQAGYFDSASHEKWLLHTWSLSVEWQFYLIYPILIVGLNKFFTLKKLTPLLVFLTLISFIASVILTELKPTAAFYLLPTRAWEMLFGGLVFLTPVCLTNRNKIILENSGLFLIFFSVFYFTSDFIWPSYYALLPVIGTALVLISSRDNSILTNNRFSNWFGKASYSIYLWHWPIVVLLSYESLLESYIWVFTGVLSSFIFGYLSYRFIESLARKDNKNLINLSFSYKIGMISIFTMAAGSYVYINNGINHQIRAKSQSDEALLIEEYKYIHKNLGETYNLKCDFYSNIEKESKSSIPKGCTTLDINKKGVFIWGDSHAQALYFGLSKLLSNDNTIQQVATSACKPSLIDNDNSKLDNNCNISNYYAIEEIKKTKPVVVIISQSNNHEYTDWDNIGLKLKTLGVKKVILVGPVPQWKPSLPNLIARKYFEKYKAYVTNNKSIYIPITTIEEKILRSNELLAKYKDSNNIFYISLIDELCNEGICLASIPDKKELLVVDYGHLSNDASVFVANIIMNKVKLDNENENKQ